MKKLLFILLLLPLLSVSQQFEVEVISHQDFAWQNGKAVVKFIRHKPNNSSTEYGLDFDGDLTVNYTITGTGANKVNVSSGSVVIKDEEARAFLEIGSLNTVVGIETFTVTVSSSANYTLGVSSSVNLEVRDAEPIKAFPSAFGAASYISGGRGGDVYHVTNLNDSGAGSLRNGLGSYRAVTGRTIVFDVGGTIELQSALEIGTYGGNLTVLGATAPGDGILITSKNHEGYGFFVSSGCSNVIIRDINFVGEQPLSSVQGGVDTVGVFVAWDIIFDHCSFMRSPDEIISLQGSSTHPMGNISITNSLIAEGAILADGNNHSTASHIGGNHATGLTDYWKSNTTPLDYTWSRNVVTRVSHRFPNTIGSGRFEVINNVVYNWIYRLNHTAYDGINIQRNNYYRWGAATTQIGAYPTIYTMNKLSHNEYRLPYIYNSGNYISGGSTEYVLPSETPKQQFDKMNTWFVSGSGDFADRVAGNPVYDRLRITTEPDLLQSDIPIVTAQEAYNDLVVNKNVGATRRLEANGTVTKREPAKYTELLDEIINDTGGAHPTRESWYSSYITFPSSTRPVGYDTDNDGIPNTYEIAKGWNPDVADNNVVESNGYTRLETFANEVDGEVVEPIPSTPKAFPSAYGAGYATTGGRGGVVIHVTNLNDSGAGSLREAIMTTGVGARTVVFDVSGTIELLTHINIYEGNITIAGQTAPSGGITITGKGFRMSTNQWGDGHNFIMRYVRFRAGFVRNGLDMNVELNNSHDIIIDHCSFAWAGDKAIGISDVAYNVTVQNSLIGECNTAMILGLAVNPGIKYISHDMSALRNIFYDSSHRFPNFNGSGRFDAINNVGYNYRYRLVLVGSEAQTNVINNYYDAGTNNPNWYANDVKMKYTAFDELDDISLADIYSEGNIIKDWNGQANQWGMWTTIQNDNGFWDYNGVTYGNGTLLPENEFRRYTAFPQLGEAIPVLAGDVTLLDTLLTDIGANKSLNADGTYAATTDAIDTRFITNMTNRTYVPYDWNEDWATYPHYTNYRASISSTPVATRPVGYDTDGDGIPNDFEVAKGWNPNVANNNVIDSSTGITQLETFLNMVDTEIETPVTIPVTGASISPTTSTGDIGTTTQLTAIIAPSNATNQNVTWTSSNPSVATVSSSGLVTRVSEGTATIGFITTDGSFTASATITVNAAVSVPLTNRVLKGKGQIIEFN